MSAQPEASEAPPSFRRRFEIAWRRLRGGSLSPLRAGLSVAVGLFVGAVPVYGFQLLIILAVCIPTRLDAAVAYVAAHVSNPLTLPLLLLIEVEVGALLLTGAHADVRGALDPERLGEFGLQLALGAPAFGAGLAVLGGAVAWSIAGRRGLDDPFRRATELTLARYRSCHPRDRIYVRAKLEIDPLPRALTNLGEPLGRLVDAGSGLGQLGLCLVDAGLVTHLTAFDTDMRAIDVARAAAPEAAFSVGGFATFAWPESDTVLFADSLHYAPLAVQDGALGAAVRALAPGGRLIVREVDARPGWRSLLTRLSERVGAALRPGGSSHAYRSTEQLVGVLSDLGLDVRRIDDPVGGPFDNPIVIGHKPLTG